MDIGEMKDKKDQQVETRWVPTTPIKPILQKTVPICAPVQEDQPQIPTYGDGAVACSKFTGFMEKNKMPCIGSVTECEMKNIVGENSEAACVKTVSGDPPALGLMSSSQLQQSSGNPQGTSFVGCSQIASLPMNNSVVEFDAACTSIKMDGIQEKNTPQSKQKKRKYRPKVIVESKPKRTQKPTEEKNVQPKENSTGKRKYVRRKGINTTPTTPAEETTGLIKDLTSESTKKSCKRTLFDGFAGTENAIAPDKDSEVGDNTSKSSRGRKKSEESQPIKRKYIRKKTYTPTAEGTASCDKEAQDPSQRNPPEAQPLEKTNKKRGRKNKTPNKSYPMEATVGFSEPLILGPNSRSRSSQKSREESSTGGQNSNACINQRSGMMNIVHSHDTSTQQGVKDFCIFDTQVQNTSATDNFIDVEQKKKQAKRMRYSKRNATNKVSFDHEPSNEDIKALRIFSPESTSHETKPIVNCSFEDDRNKRDQTTADEKRSDNCG